MKVILGHVQSIEKNGFKEMDFKDLTIVDKMMMVKLLDFAKIISDDYDKFDLKKVYENSFEFVVRIVSEFYLDFSKYRRRRLNKTSALDKDNVGST